MLKFKENAMSQSEALEILKGKKKKTDEIDLDTEGTEDSGEAVESDGEPEAPKKPAAKKATAKKAPTKKAPAKTKAATATKAKTTTAKTKAVDEIEQAATEIENMTEADALKALHDMQDVSAFDEFRKGGIFARILNEQWFGDYANFRSFVEGEFNIKYRRAMHWVAIYNDLVESSIPWAKVKRVGWTKLKYLSPILTQDNIDEILGAIEGMNVLQVAQFCKDYTKTGSTKASVPEEGDKLKSKTFRLYDGQKETVELALEKAKEVGDTEADSAALEYICLDYLGGSSKKKTKVETKVVTEAEIEEKEDLIPFIEKLAEQFDDEEEALANVLGAVSAVFPNAKINVKLVDG